jgi:hypothetical protein
MKIKTLSILAAAAFALTSCSSGSSRAEDSAAIAKGLTGALEKLSEAGAPKDLLAGDWKLSDVNMPMPKEATKEQMDMMKAAMDEMKANSTFSFMADGTYAMNMVAGGKTQTRKGTWKISDDGKKMMTTEEGATKTDEIEIAELTASTLRLKQTDNGETIEMTWTKK